MLKDIIKSLKEEDAEAMQDFLFSEYKGPLLRFLQKYQEVLETKLIKQRLDWGNGNIETLLIYNKLRSEGQADFVEALKRDLALQDEKLTSGDVKRQPKTGKYKKRVTT